MIVTTHGYILPGNIYYPLEVSMLVTRGAGRSPLVTHVRGKMGEFTIDKKLKRHCLRRVHGIDSATWRGDYGDVRKEVRRRLREYREKFSLPETLTCVYKGDAYARLIIEEDVRSSIGCDVRVRDLNDYPVVPFRNLPKGERGRYLGTGCGCHGYSRPCSLEVARYYLECCSMLDRNFAPRLGTQYGRGRRAGPPPDNTTRSCPSGH